MASGLPTTIDFEVERRAYTHRRIEPFNLRAPLAVDLPYLLELTAHGRLDPQIGLRDSWDNVTDAAQALLDRKVAGKAALDVS